MERLHPLDGKHALLRLDDQHRSPAHRPRGWAALRLGAARAHHPRALPRLHGEQKFAMGVKGYVRREHARPRPRNRWLRAAHVHEPRARELARRLALRVEVSCIVAAARVAWLRKCTLPPRGESLFSNARSRRAHVGAHCLARPRAVAERIALITEQEREVQVLNLKAADFAAQVKVTDDMIKAYYDKNAALFEIPETMKAQYVVLTADALAAQVTVSEDDIAEKIAEKLSASDIAEQFSASDIAEELSVSDIAEQVDIEQLAEAISKIIINRLTQQV